MTVLFRHTDTRHGFTWESDAQPAARWHGPGEGPTQYLCSTPEGAWAEFLRHEEIVDPAELEGVTRRVWAIEVPDDLIGRVVAVRLPHDVMRGGPDTYPRCRAEAATLRAAGVEILRVPSAALDDAVGYRSTGIGYVDGDARPAENYIAFVAGAAWTGWMCHDVGRPDPALLTRVRPLHG